MRNEREQHKQESRTLTEKLSTIQRDYDSKRQEYEYDRTQFQTKFAELTAELHTYKANNRIHEER